MVTIITTMTTAKNAAAVTIITTITTVKNAAVGTIITTMTTVKNAAVGTIITTMTTARNAAAVIITTTMTTTMLMRFFSSIGRETVRKYTPAELEFALQSLDSGEFGAVLRAKGIVQGQDGQWLHFDYVPGEINVRTGSADVTGRLCVIGSGLAEDAICNLFHVK